MTILQTRNQLKKYIDIADEDAIMRIQNFVDTEKDCINFLTKEQLLILDKAIKDADKGLGISHNEQMKSIKKKWLVK